VTVETLTYAALAERLKCSPEAARALARRLRLPRSKGNDGKTLVTVDVDEIRHTPLPPRSPRGDHMVTVLKARIESLEALIAKLEISAVGHRLDFERERDRADRLVTELLRLTGDMMEAKETAAKLEGELAAIRELLHKPDHRPVTTWREMNWRERIRWLRTTG
jgi:hypothetical protein